MNITLFNFLLHDCYVRNVTTNFSLDIMDLSYVSITFKHICSVCTSNKKAFQLKANRPPSDRYMDCKMNEFEQVEGGPDMVKRGWSQVNKVLGGMGLAPGPVKGYPYMLGGNRQTK